MFRMLRVLKDIDEPGVKKALPNYLKILEGKIKPRFKQDKARLNEKIKAAFKVLENCGLCERNCHVNRLKGQLGHCRLGNKMIISTYFDHYGEEPQLIPSFTIFFWSCSFHCQFCQNWTISQRIEPGTTITEKELAAAIDSHSYCRNVNFVGGEPTPQLPFIFKTLSYVKADIPTLWNSNFYMTKKSMALLKNMIDVYLSDFKYGNDKCAKRLSKVDNYTSVVKRNHLLAFKDSELVIRHLILPNHIECCTKPILKFIADNFSDKVIVNIMDQYRPQYMAEHYPEINRPITTEEFKAATTYAEKLGLNFIT